MSDASGNLLEVFISIQGEGIRLGESHLFVRFFGCNLRCRYCDTSLGDEPPADFPVDLPGVSLRHKNPMDAGLLAALIADNLPDYVSAVSFTGGEPLYQPGFLDALLSQLSQDAKGLPDIYLETNGSLPDELARIADRIDTIAMDMKLPSMYGGEPLWDEHRRSLKAAPEKTFVKVVVGRGMDAAEFDEAVKITAAVDGRIPFVIQPVWPVDLGGSSLIQLQIRALARLSDVRVIVQQQEILGIR